MSIYKPRNSRKGYKYDLYVKSGSPFNSWEKFIAHNITQECDNPACVRLRVSRGKYCLYCQVRATRYGDPRWGKVRVQDYKEYYNQAKELIDYNLENIVVVDFVEKLHSMADHAHQGINVEWASWLKPMHISLHKATRTNRHQRDAYKILAHLVGLYVFSEVTRIEYIKSDRIWYYALADVLLHGINKQLRPSKTSGAKRVHRFGRFVWDVFGVTIIQLGRAVLKNEVLKANRKKALEQAVILLPEEGR